jgi:YHS domain-containing protein
MKSYTTHTSFLLAIAVMSLLTVSTLAQKKKGDHHEHQHSHETKGVKAATSNPAKSEGHDHQGAAEKSQDKQKSEKQFLGKGDGVETCPVTGEPISKEIKAEIKGRTVYACCPDCLDTVKKDPDLYLKQESGEKKEGKQEEKKEPTFLGKGDGIETCPVMGMPVNKEVKIEIKGRTVYACCPGCLDTIKENPDLYLKKTDNK